MASFSAMSNGPLPDESTSRLGRCWTRLAVSLLGVAFAGIIASSALAADFCVNRTGCTVANTYAAGQLQTAITAADGVAGANRVLVGPGTYTGPFTESPSAAAVVSVIGAGQGQTTLQVGGAGPAYALQLSGSGASVSDLTINVIAGTSNRGLQLSNSDSATRVTVTSTATAAGTLGVSLGGNGLMSSSTVILPRDDGEGVAINSGAATLSDSTVHVGTAAGQGSIGVTYSGGPATLLRDSITAFQAVTGDGGSAVVNDSLIVLTGSQATGLSAVNGNTQVGNQVNSLTAKRDTLVGDGSAGQVGVYAFGGPANAGASNVANVTFDSSVISGVAIPLRRLTGSGGTVNGPANLTTDYSDYNPTGDLSSGAGTTTENHSLNVAPAFVSAATGDYHLLYNSPLVDAGDPTAPPAGTTDRDANPRPIDGTGTGTARVDVGAFEYQRPLPTVTASAAPSSATSGQAVTFSATVAAADPGDSVAVTWAFDDGASGSGASVAHAFATPGSHTATATATAANGRQASAMASVTVAAPAASPAGSTPASGAPAGGPGPLGSPDPGAHIPPVISALRVSPRQFSLGPLLPSGSRAHGGAIISFSLSEAASVRLTFTQRLPRHGRRKPHGGRGMSMTLTVSAHAGANRLSFEGRISPSASLVPGSYALSVGAMDATGARSQTLSANLTVVRSRHAHR